MNKVFLIGNLTRDPELSTTQSGVSMCRFAVAVNRPFTNASGQRDVDFIDVTAWRALGENCHKYLRKGRKACVVGRIETRTYEQEGVKKYAFGVVADEVEFLSSPDGAPQGQGDGAPRERSAAPAPEKKKVSELTPLEDENLPF
jgi:single-strand DNA-binding protein